MTDVATYVTETVEVHVTNELASDEKEQSRCLFGEKDKRIKFDSYLLWECFELGNSAFADAVEIKSSKVSTLDLKFLITNASVPWLILTLKSSIKGK